MGRGDSELALAQLFSRFTERMPKAVRLPFATDWRCDRSVTDPGQSLPALNKASSRPAPTVVPNGKLVRTVAPSKTPPQMGVPDCRHTARA